MFFGFAKEILFFKLDIEKAKKVDFLCTKIG